MSFYREFVAMPGMTQKEIELQRQLLNPEPCQAHRAPEEAQPDPAPTEENLSESRAAGQKMRIPRCLIGASLAADSGGEDRRASLKWYTGAKVRRLSWDGTYYLTLSLKPEHVRMERLQSGKAPLLNSHNSSELSDILGVVESATLDGSASVLFSDRDEVTPIWNDVNKGIIRNASVGAAIYKLQDVSKKDKDGNVVSKEFLAVDWEPMEVSLVPIGADPNAGFRFAGEMGYSDADIVD